MNALWMWMACVLGPGGVAGGGRIELDAVVDRVEGGVAVLEVAASETWDVPVDWLPVGSVEGKRVSILVRHQCWEQEMGENRD